MSETQTIKTESEAWTRLENSPQWAALTESQRLWVLDFLASGGSALDATKTAYKAKSEANARVLSYELAKNPTIVAALDVAAGHAPKNVLAVDPERTRLIREVRKQLRAAEEGSVAASRLTAQLERLTLGIKLGRPEVAEENEPETDAQPSSATASIKFHVGQRVTQRDAEGVLHTGQVLAVDADGRPTKIEEVL